MEMESGLRWVVAESSREEDAHKKRHEASNRVVARGTSVCV